MKDIQEYLCQKCTSETIVLYNQTNLLHKSSRPHPQSPERIIPTLKNLSKFSELLGSEKIQIIQVKTQEQGQKAHISTQYIENMVMNVHGEGYWQFVKEMWHEGIKKPQMYINKDTYFMKDTYKAAIEAARTTVIGTDLVIKNKNTQKSLVLVRPPGHHSGMKSQPHGFSFFNNLALGVTYALEQQNIKKIAIIDWDVHHGEGTQKLFYDRKDVLFISMHRYDKGKFFPHIPQSSSEHIGIEKGVGFNVNICWDLPEKVKGQVFERGQTCGDEEYAYSFDQVVIPILHEFNPDMIFVSCGFDSALGDTIGGLAVTPAGYTYMTERLMQMKKKMTVVLEGGYNPDVILWATQCVMRALNHCVVEEVKEKVQKLRKKQYEVNEIGKNGVDFARKQLKKLWKNI